MLRYVFYCTDLQKFYSLALKKEGRECMHGEGEMSGWGGEERE